MMHAAVRHPLSCPSSPQIAAMLAVAWLFVWTDSAAAYSPTHPKVQAIVGKARQFLNKCSPSTMGQHGIVAMALLKSGSPVSDPKIQESIKTIRGNIQGESYGSPVNYNVATTIIALIEVDPVQYRPEIEALLKVLLSRQEGHGGWSYWPGEGGHGRQEGDSSMTQYGTLALWAAHRAKFNVPPEAIERVTNFWIRTQTPEGAWGYQGHVAPLGQRIPQEGVRPSIGVAGLSGVYICGELFGLAKGDKKRTSGISAALQKVEQPKAQQQERYVSAKGVNLDLLRQSQQLGEQYIARSRNGYTQDTWEMFYLYGMERFRSFQELYEGTHPENAKWYDDGVDFLAKTQAQDGSWSFSGHTTAEAAFGVLFLVRSTKKSIEREFGDGLVRGGRGLPTDIGKVMVDEKTGDVINPEVNGTIEQLMSILDDPKNTNFESVARQPDKLIEALVRPDVDEDQRAREQRIERLKSMVSTGNYQQRTVAVKALSRTGNLDNVPLLLYALTDPDPRVMRAAEQGLRFISRKFDGFGLPDDPKPDELEQVRLQWKQWFLALRPDAELLD